MGIVKGLSVVLAATALVGIAGCKKTATIPTPVLATETKTGTVKPGGTDTQTFTVGYIYSGTDAQVTVKSITSVATGAALSITIGVGFGQFGFDGSCTKSTQFTDNAVPIGAPRSTSPYAPFTGPLNYCVAVFDAGTVTEPVNYTIELQHY